MAVINAYFDESGTHGDAAFFTLAGFLGTCAEWQQFEGEWTPLLSGYGVTKFRMADIESRRGEFTGWPSDRVVAFVKNAAEIIRKRQLVGFATAVSMREYSKSRADLEAVSNIFPSGRHLANLIAGDQYALAWGLAMNLVADWAHRTNYTGKIDYVFEENSFKVRSTALYMAELARGMTNFGKAFDWEQLRSG